MLLRSAQEHPSLGVRLISSEREHEAVHVTYPALLAEARRILGGLQASEYPTGASVVLLLEYPGDIIPAFWACVLGGYVPCPLAPIRNDPERWAKHLAHVGALLDRPLLITTGSLRKDLPGGVMAMDLDDLRAAKPQNMTHEAKLTDPAVLMLTSGSTGNSKAVVLTHGNLLASMAGKAERQQLTAADVTLNWIAFDHVAALLEVHMVSQYVGAAQVHVEPSAILSDPLLFLRLIDRYRVSMAFAPNFLLGQINAALQSPKFGLATLPLELNLSCLRYIITGGEANVVETGCRFLDLLAPYGLARDVLRPAFGMTETSAASVYSHDFPVGDAKREFASVGLPITGFQMRIVGDHGAPLPAGEPGELQVRGPMVFTRYHNDEDATRAAFTPDGWFRTGDLGRIEDGRLNLVGRSKDCIIVNGVNYFSHELETALEQLSGIERSFVAAFPTRAKGADTEQLVVAFATTFPWADEARLHQLTMAIRSTVVLLWGFKPALMLPLPKGAFPKTSLGKIQRALMRKRLEAGEFEAHEAHIAEVRSRQSGGYTPPEGPEEKVIAEIFSDVLGLDPRHLSATASFFDLGGTSLDIIKLKQHLEQRLDLADIPLVHILQNPTVRALARRETDHYDPVVPLQLTGDKTPLFCVHPGVGEILVYVSLASYFVNERPFYAVRARGFNESEQPFETLDEMVRVYVDAIRRRQPHGPYAIAGYSFGGPVAFEIAKVLESQGERVPFVGCIDETPFLAEPSAKLEGVEGPLHVAFLLGLIDRKQLDELPARLRGAPPDQDPCDPIIQIAPPGRLAELDMDLRKFKAWAALSRSLVVLGQSYVPSGSVESMTVFYAHPLHGTKRHWLEDVKRWDHFSRGPNRYIDVAGEHHSLMGKQHVGEFQAVLRAEVDRAMGGR
ncbi:non-ribosomal peptide synthetase [Polyangium sp. 6x1]|uniref:non-ribosomal peptide synthetase n=1 Tax=Polyangium sp. 6x1 TaxID=3042689 RepID=UPI0032B10DC3